MGNIGGRSNGCITCLNRHLKCDEGKPTCDRCNSARLQCEGYRGLPVTLDPHVQRIDPHHSASAASIGLNGFGANGFSVMANHNSIRNSETSPRDMSSTIRHSDMYPRYTSTADRNGATALSLKKPPRGRPRKSSQPTKKPTNRIVRRNTPEHSAFPPVELNLSAFQEPICVTFLVQNFLGHLDTGRKSLLPAWDVEYVSGTARESVNALAMAFFGKAKHQQNIIVQGAECYGKALRKLANDLNDQNAMWSSSVLLSSILLARYELVVSEGSSGWIQHAGGVERLFELRGPRRHQSLEERHIFEAARPIIAIKAITDCKRTFLDQPDWLTIPWAQDPGQKSSMNLLIDIFCIVPGLLEEAKRLHTGTSFLWLYSTPTSPSSGASAARQDPRLVALRHRTQECFAKLQRWKEAWDDTYPSAVHPVKVSFFPKSDLRFPEDIFEHAFNFPSFLRASEYQLYNTVVFFLCGLMLSVPAASQGDFDSSPRTDDLLGQRWDAAYNICRAVPYDLYDKHGGGGAYLLLFPLLTTLRLFGEGSEEGKWIKQVLGSIANKWGMEGDKKYMLLEG